MGWAEFYDRVMAKKGVDSALAIAHQDYDALGNQLGKDDVTPVQRLGCKAARKEICSWIRRMEIRFGKYYRDSIRGPN